MQRCMYIFEFSGLKYDPANFILQLIEALHKIHGKHTLQNAGEIRIGKTGTAF